MTKYTKMSNWHKEVPTDDNDDDEAIPWTASTSERSKISDAFLIISSNYLFLYMPNLKFNIERILMQTAVLCKITMALILASFCQLERPTTTEEFTSNFT